MNGAGLALAACAAAAGNALNAAAGGGSFISFPALLFLGVPPIAANATNSAGMWTGGFGLIGGYRAELAHPTRRLLAAIGVCILGGTLGGFLVLQTPARTFSALVPWLLLVSTLLFALGPFIRKLTKSTDGGVRDVPYAWFVPLFAVAVYGGFFSGGQGILLLAIFVLAGMTDINRMNALKSTIAFINNGTPLLPFILAGVVRWDLAIAMSIGATAGGYAGARIARRIPPDWVRRFIIAVGAVMTAVFFLRT